MARTSDAVVEDVLREHSLTRVDLARAWLWAGRKLDEMPAGEEMLDAELRRVAVAWIDAARPSPEDAAALSRLLARAPVTGCAPPAPPRTRRHWYSPGATGTRCGLGRRWTPVAASETLVHLAIAASREDCCMRCKPHTW